MKKIGSCMYSIKMGGKFLQSVDINETYVSNAKAPTMGVCHDCSEYKTIWGNEPVFFERLTAASNMKILMEEFRWGDRKAQEVRLIPHYQET